MVLGLTITVKRMLCLDPSLGMEACLLPLTPTDLSSTEDEPIILKEMTIKF